MLADDLPRDWLRGVLEPCLLALLAEGKAYGYELAARMERAGLGPVPGGSLYPALLRMQRQGWLTAQWQAGAGGPGRKYYRLTQAGRAALADNVARWDHFATAVTSVLRTGARR